MVSSRSGWKEIHTSQVEHRWNRMESAAPEQLPSRRHHAVRRRWTQTNCFASPRRLGYAISSGVLRNELAQHGGERSSFSTRALPRQRVDVLRYTNCNSWRLPCRLTLSLAGRVDGPRAAPSTGRNRPRPRQRAASRFGVRIVPSFKTNSAFSTGWPPHTPVDTSHGGSSRG